MIKFLMLLMFYRMPTKIGSMETNGRYSVLCSMFESGVSLYRGKLIFRLNTAALPMGFQGGLKYTGGNFYVTASCNIIYGSSILKVLSSNIESIKIKGNGIITGTGMLFKSKDWILGPEVRAGLIGGEFYGTLSGALSYKRHLFMQAGINNNSRIFCAAFGLAEYKMLILSAGLQFPGIKDIGTNALVILPYINIGIIH